MDNAALFGALASWLLLTRELLLIAAAGIAISSIDDLFIDIAFAGRWLLRRLTIYTRHRRVSAGDLVSNGREGRMAIFVPAWDEADVIAPMLRSFAARTQYGNYRVFVGVYPNDAATHAAVAALADPRIEIVVAPQPGPTTKADCLNAVWRAMIRHEVHGIR